MTKSRMEAFSDGVIAVIITIMVLEMRAPLGSDPAALKPLIPVFLSYVMSFVFLGIYWNNHHHMLQAVRSVNGSILWANLHLLFWLSLAPFVTNWMGETHFARWPVMVYGIVLLLAGIAYYILARTLAAHHGPESALATRARDRFQRESLDRDLYGRDRVRARSALDCLHALRGRRADVAHPGSKVRAGVDGARQMSLEILRRARDLDFGPHGFGQDTSEQAKVFLTALERRDVELSEVEDHWEEASPAGRVYGAWLLRVVNPDAGHAMLTRLLDEHDYINVLVPRTCRKRITPVSCCARWLLDAGEMPVPYGMPECVGYANEEFSWEMRKRYTESAEGMREIENTNTRTEKLIQREMKERGLRCPFCGARGLHRSYTHAAPLLSYVLCVKCWRTFTG